MPDQKKDINVSIGLRRPFKICISCQEFLREALGWLEGRFSQLFGFSFKQPCHFQN